MENSGKQTGMELRMKWNRREKKLKLIKNTAERLLQISALILTINLGISTSFVRSVILEKIKYPIIISTSLLIISIILGWILSASLIEKIVENSQGNSDEIKEQHLVWISRGQFWLFLLGIIFMLVALIFRMEVISCLN